MSTDLFTLTENKGDHSENKSYNYFLDGTLVSFSCVDTHIRKTDVSIPTYYIFEYYIYKVNIHACINKKIYKSKTTIVSMKLFFLYKQFKNFFQSKTDTGK